MDSSRPATLTHLVFGYGSVVNCASRTSTLGGTTSSAALTARLLPTFGHTRSWCFRASTGFTALGLQREHGGSPINGVLFAVDAAALAKLDAREAGYTRQQVDAQHVEVVDSTPGSAAAAVLTAALSRPATCVIWVYQPCVECCAPASVEHPIVQSYVDVCVSGFLDAADESFASEFIATTSGWSAFYLNDVPASRRPWLHRSPAYATIDRLLAAHENITLLSRRCHPEEFAAQHLTAGLRGMWGVPRRNTQFIGRHAELSALRTALLAGGVGGMTQADLVGLGGVGKTQLAIEYCHRWSAGADAEGADDGMGKYGFIAWLSAQTAESAVGDLRRLASDCGVQVADRPAAEVVDELKARLFRSTVPWLLVFDNVESPSSVAPFLPRGCSASRGHVLVTTRRAGTAQTAKVYVDCFSPDDSAAFLVRNTGAASCEGAAALAEHLGHLPLALAVAAAYMRRADVSCTQYLHRVQATRQVLEAAGDGCVEPASGAEYPLSVASSLSLSLDAIAKQSSQARAVLDSLSYLAPDAISKPLLRELLRQVATWPREEPCARLSGTDNMLMQRAINWHQFTRDATCASSIAAAFTFAAFRRRGRRKAATAAFAASLLTAAGIIGVYASAGSKHIAAAAFTATPAPTTAVHPVGDAELDSACDDVWALLKGFSLLVVRGSEGSLHRLLSLVIRSGHSARRAKQCVRAACDALTALWTFTPGDAASWSTAGVLIEHVKAVGTAAGQHGVRAADVAHLMVGAGAFTSVALSRFGEARELLESALAVAQRACEGTSAAAALPPPVLSDAHFELAKVLRYQGELSAAESAANEALTLRSNAAAARGETGKCCRVAHVLHELGVIRCRLHDVPGGTVLLRRALAEKRAAGAPPEETANTLHHLALAAMNARPPDLAAAEALLRHALEAGGDHASAASAAATWQQLGRLELRRGRPQPAAEALTRALDLARQAYGRAPHVNVAAIEQALGECAMARGDNAAAERHLREALEMRRHIYGGGIPPLQLATTLGSLGRLVARRGDTPGALRLFQEQRAVLRQLQESGPPDQRAAATHQLGASLRWARDAATAGTSDALEQLDAELEAVRNAQRSTARGTTPGGCIQQHHHIAGSPLQLAVVRCRAGIRSMLRDAQSAGRRVTGDELRGCVAQLVASLADATSDHDPVAASATALVNAAETMARQADEEGDAAAAAAAIRGTLFEACDAVRDALRAVGVRVEDVASASTES